MLSLEEYSYNVKAIIEYDGTRYSGFQIQKDKDSIEGELTNTISRVLKEEIKIIGSGRTDAHVHAKGQVINFYTSRKIDESRLKYAINRMLEKDIRVIDLKYTDMSFHSRFSAKKKEYHYLIKFDNFSAFDFNYYLEHKKMDLNKVNEVLELFKGSHNYHSFTTNDVDKRKNFNKFIYEAKVIKHSDYYEFIFIGDGFLRYQIRKMMAVILDYADSKIDLDFIKGAFEKEDPLYLTKIASPNGLYLMKVMYEE